jgi:hypothetical protein
MVARDIHTVKPNPQQRTVNERAGAAMRMVFSSPCVNVTARPCFKDEVNWHILCPFLIDFTKLSEEK